MLEHQLEGAAAAINGGASHGVRFYSGGVSTGVALKEPTYRVTNRSTATADRSAPLGSYVEALTIAARTPGTQVVFASETTTATAVRAGA